MVVIDHGLVAFLADGGAVHQLAGADQHAVHEDGVIGRDQQIAVRHARGKGIAFDADRLSQGRVGMAPQIQPAMADPTNRPRLAGGGQYELAFGQVLDRGRSGRRVDPRAGGKTGQLDIAIAVAPERLGAGYGT